MSTTTTDEQVEEVSLFVFPTHLFPDRDAIRAFVRGPIGCCIDMVCQSVIDDGRLETNELLPYWRRHAVDLLFDFGNLARAAATPDDVSLVVVTFESGDPGRAETGDLETMHACFEIAVTANITPDYVRPLAELIARLEARAAEVRHGLPAAVKEAA